CECSTSSITYGYVCGPYGAITLGAAVIGFHMSRAKRFDKNVTELLESLGTIRTKAFLAQGETLDSAFYEAIRHLQRDISQRTRIMGTPFTFRSEERRVGKECRSRWSRDRE